MTEAGEFVTYEDGAAFEKRARKDSDMAHAVLEELGLLGMNK